MEKKIFKVVLTGGPCAGKTSSMAMISDHFHSLGWRVYTVKEAATIVLSGGVPITEMNEEQVLSIQKNIVKVMMALEQVYTEIAHHSTQKQESTLILCDRGIMDASVYCSKDLWKRILNDLKVSQVDVKDNRYDCVIHMVTAASGAEKFYTLENNHARSETIEQAVTIDEKTLKAWSGHPHLHVIDNSTTNFKEKVLTAMACICRRVGVQAPSKSIMKRKYLVKPESAKEISLELEKQFEVHTSNCEYTFLDGIEDSFQRRLRKRGVNQTYTYTLTDRSKKLLKDGEYYERKEKLTKPEYKMMKKMQNQNTQVVRSVKQSFVYAEQYFELSTYFQPERLNGIVILETYCSLKSQVELPECFVGHSVEVTDNSVYSLYNLSMCNTEMNNNKLIPNEKTNTFK
jgi:thymidylate kinase